MCPCICVSRLYSLNGWVDFDEILKNVGLMLRRTKGVYLCLSVCLREVSVCVSVCLCVPANDF